MSEQKREYTGTWIPAYIMEDKSLIATDKLLYAEIASYKRCFVSNDKLAERMGMTSRGVQDTIKRLKDSGYIIQVSFDGRKRTLAATQSLHPSITPEREAASRGSSYIDNNIENNRETLTSASQTDLDKTQGEARPSPSSAPPPPTHKGIDLTELFKKLIDELGTPRAKFPAKRVSKMKQRLNTFSEEELITAAKNIKASPHMQGRNDNNKFYGTIEYLLRNDENVEKWIQEATQPKRSAF